MIKSIWAIGRNYSDHAKELGNAIPEQPIIFLKSGSTLVPNGRAIRLPTWSQDVHYETEIAVRFASANQIDALTIALDLTARDVQNELKAKSLPWTLAKSFTDSCPLGDWVPTSKLATKSAKEPEDIWTQLQELEFEFSINGERKQRGFTKDMIFSIQEICNYLFLRFPVQAGDVLLTGTPAGVGPLKSGDQLSAEIKGLTRANWPVL